MLVIHPLISVKISVQIFSSDPCTLP